jgi:aspartate carbamoyltransferase regulatory subunit
MVLFLFSFGRALPSINISISETENKNNSLKISEEVYYRQTLNNCAAYSVMAVINILKGVKVDPEELAKEINWRVYKNLTYPQGVIDLLKKYSIRTKEYSLYLYSDEDKICWLKNCIDNEMPIILLIEVKHVKHYFTILGYDEKGFMIYDSLQEKSKDNPRKTITDNPRYAGNRYYTYDSVLKLWSDGGFLLFFRNWAITCS